MTLFLNKRLIFQITVEDNKRGINLTSKQKFLENIGMKSSLKAPEEQITEIMKRIYSGGMTTASGGNISLKEENGDIWSTPGGIDKGSLTPGDIVCIKNDGSVQSKYDYKPTSEFPTHQAIYEKRDDLKAIIHAHPPALVSFSAAKKVPETKAIPQAYNLCGKVGYASYKISGSDALGLNVSEEFEKGHDCVIMENHATIVGGSNLLEAFHRLETLEYSARAIINSFKLGVYKTLNINQIEDFFHRNNDLPVSDETTCQPEERQTRDDICRIVKRACNQHLMIGTYGTVSVREKGNNFLITPTDIDRSHIKHEDIVRIKKGERERGKKPSRAVRLHQAIYNSHPHINCIITSQPPNILAFCISGSSLDTRISPESYVLLKDMPTIPFGGQLNEGGEVVRLISKEVPVLLIQNDAILITGDSIFEAFDRLEVAEFTAMSLINAMSIGEAIPIDDREIKLLKEKFLN